MFPIGRASSRVSFLSKRLLSTSVQRLSTSRFDPPYLNLSEPEVPEYPYLNVQMKSHDFTILEHYAKWVHKTALNMGIEVEETWAAPTENIRIQKFQPNSAKVDCEYKLNMYERTVQLADLSSILAPLFMEVIQHGLPEGVELCVREHMPEDSEVRYIPDLELKDLRVQLDELGGPSKSKN